MKNIIDQLEDLKNETSDYCKKSFSDPSKIKGLSLKDFPYADSIYNEELFEIIKTINESQVSHTCKVINISDFHRFVLNNYYLPNRIVRIIYNPKSELIDEVRENPNYTVYNNLGKYFISSSEKKYVTVPYFKRLKKFFGLYRPECDETLYSRGFSVIEYPYYGVLYPNKSLLGYSRNKVINIPLEDILNKILYIRSSREGYVTLLIPRGSALDSDYLKSPKKLKYLKFKESIFNKLGLASDSLYFIYIICLTFSTFLSTPFGGSWGLGVGISCLLLQIFIIYLKVSYNSYNSLISSALTDYKFFSKKSLSKFYLGMFFDLKK